MITKETLTLQSLLKADGKNVQLTYFALQTKEPVRILRIFHKISDRLTLFVSSENSNLVEFNGPCMLNNGSELLTDVEDGEFKYLEA
jgi:hypothetical protein